MLAKVISAWLVVLTLTPFTAPFPTCDLETLVTEHRPAPAHGTSRPTTLADASLTQAVPFFRASARVRVIALAETRTASHAPALCVARVQFLGPVSTTARRIDSSILRI
jgi:hypothetical protein